MTSVSVAERPPRETARTGRRRQHRRGIAWLYLAPTIIALLIWVYGPLLLTGVLSILDWNLVSTDAGWAGLDNYRHLVSQPEVANAVQNTLLYAVGVLPFATVLPCALAIMLWKRPGRASRVYQVLLFLPVVLAPVANAVAWRFILDPLQGMLNVALGYLGVSPVNWLGDSSTALPTIVAVTAGKVLALNTMLFGAALANLDRRTLEAARLDNASEWEITRFVIVPQVRRTMVLLALLCLVVVWPWLFTNIAVLTKGGPSGATDNIYYLMYTYAFTFFDAGTASAMAVAISIAFAILLGAYSMMARRRRADG